MVRESGKFMVSKVREVQHKCITAFTEKNQNKNKINRVSSVGKSVIGRRIVGKVVLKVETLQMVETGVVELEQRFKRIDQPPGTRNSIVLCTKGLRGEDAAAGHARH